MCTYCQREGGAFLSLKTITNACFGGCPFSQSPFITVFNITVFLTCNVRLGRKVLMNSVPVVGGDGGWCGGPSSCHIAVGPDPTSIDY